MSVLLMQSPPPRWLREGEEILYMGTANWENKRGNVYLTDKRFVWKCTDAGLSADIVIPLDEIRGYRKNRPPVDSEALSFVCMLQLNTTRAGLITMEVLPDITNELSSVESRDLFLQKATPLLKSCVHEKFHAKAKLPTRPKSEAVDSATPAADVPNANGKGSENGNGGVAVAASRAVECPQSRPANSSSNLSATPPGVSLIRSPSPHALIQEEYEPDPAHPRSPQLTRAATARTSPTLSPVGSPALLESLEQITEVSVTNPTMAATGHVVYTVSTKFGCKSLLHQTRVYHRYNDFFKLNQQLIAKAPRHITLPCFPPKSWIQYVDAAVLEDRSNKLNEYFQQLLKNPAVLRNSACASLLLPFFLSGESLPEKSEREATTAAPGAFRSVIEKGDYLINNALNVKEPSAQEDYERLQQRVKQWNLTQQVFPWRKRVLTLFGTTSAGKSSLVNHLFTLTCTRSGGGQVDTSFTLVETAPVLEFVSLTTASDFPPFSEEELLAPLPLSLEEVRTDPRYGRVFVYDEHDTLKRYDQFQEHRHLLATYSKLRSIVVNEKYLRGTPEEIALAKKLIVIDSKGIDTAVTRELLDTTRSERDMQQTATEIRVMQLFIKVSDTVLFLLPHSELHNCAAQLAVFELSTICSVDQKFYGDRVKELAEKNAPPVRSGGFIRDIVDSLLEQPIELARSIVSYLQPRQMPEDVVLGNERWTKVRFVITKVDELYNKRNCDIRSEELQLYYTLGRSFGRALRYLEPPTFGSVFLLALPEKQSGYERKYTGALGTWKVGLLRHASDDSYEKKLDDAIVAMCEQLAKSLTSVGYVNTVNPVQIVEGFLYLGSMWCSTREVLKRTEISYVLNVKGGSYPDDIPEHKYKIVPLSDYGDSNLLKKLPECFEHIDAARSAQEKILVHCEGGLNRSPTVVIAYLLLREGWTLRKAMEHVAERRPSARPLDAYLEQLREIELQKRSESTVSSDDLRTWFPPLVPEEM